MNANHLSGGKRLSSFPERVFLFFCSGTARAQLVQIFQNLISNAIKYRKPEIAPRIHITAMDTPQEWIICIRDNGIGIAPEDQQRVFTPMKRLHGREIPGSV